MGAKIVLEKENDFEKNLVTSRKGWNRIRLQIGKGDKTIREMEMTRNFENMHFCVERLSQNEVIT